MGMSIEENIEKYKNLSQQEEAHATSYTEHEFFAITLKHFTEAEYYKLLIEECKANAAEYRQIAKWLEKYQKIVRIVSLNDEEFKQCGLNELKEILEVIADGNVN